MGLERTKEVIFPKSGAEKKYDLTSEYYHLIMGVFEIKPNMDALAVADIKPGDKVLDAAFGTGWMLERIIPLIGPEEKVYGIDLAKGMIRVARARLKRKNIENQAILVQGNVHAMPFKNETFDIIYNSFLLDLQKIADILKLLYEIKRVLKPDGRVIIVAMTKDGKGLGKIARCFYDWFYKIWPTIFGYRASSRPIYVRQEVEKSGFSIKKEELTHIRIFQFPVKIVVCTKG